MPAERLESKKDPDCVHRQLDTQKLNVENVRWPASAAVHSETLISAEGRYVARAPPSSLTPHMLPFR